MRRSLIFILCIIILASIISAQEEKTESFNEYRGLTLKFHIDGEIVVDLSNPNAQV